MELSITPVKNKAFCGIRGESVGSAVETGVRISGHRCRAVRRSIEEYE